CRRALSPENRREDREKRKRQHEAQYHRPAVPPQCNQCRPCNLKNQSRNSLPVRCRNTDSRLGRRSVKSSSSSPAFVASSSSGAISPACSIVNSAVSAFPRPPCRAAPTSIAFVSPANRASTWLLFPHVLST